MKISEVISEKLDYMPSSLFVRQIVRPKYVVRFPNSDRTDELQIAERAVKPYAIGRKNWLFFGSNHGGQRLAILSSFTPSDQLATLTPNPPTK